MRSDWERRRLLGGALSLVGATVLGGCTGLVDEPTSRATDTPTQTQDPTESTTATGTDQAETTTEQDEPNEKPAPPFQNWQHFKDYHRYNSAQTRGLAQLNIGGDDKLKPHELETGGILTKEDFAGKYKNDGRLVATREEIQELKDQINSIDEAINEGLNDVGVSETIGELDQLNGKAMEQVAKHAGALKFDTLDATSLVDWYLQDKGFTHDQYRLNEMSYAIAEGGANPGVIIDRMIDGELETDLWAPRGSTQVNFDTEESHVFLKSDETPDPRGTVENSLNTMFDDDGDYLFAMSNLCSMMNQLDGNNPVDPEYISNGMRSILPGDQGNPIDDLFDDVYMTVEAVILGQVIMDPSTEYDSSHIQKMSSEVFSTYDFDVDTLSKVVEENDQDMMRWELQNNPEHGFYDEDRNNMLDVYNGHHDDNKSVMIDINENGLEYNIVDRGSIDEEDTLEAAIEATL
jgi:hypothetical protein